jgi:phage gpG-like protein
MIFMSMRGGEELTTKLRRMPVAIGDALEKEAHRLAITMQGRIITEKLSGQVLHVRTGTLRRSITYKVTRDASKVEAIVGTNVKYGALHEYGGTVPQHQRLLTMVFGRPLRFPVWATVKPYELPERSFLRSTLRAMRAEIVESFTKAMQRSTR